MTQPRETLQAGTKPRLDPELVPLLRLLLRAKGFALAFLKCNAPAERQRLVEALIQALKERGRAGRVLQLMEPVVDLLEETHGVTPPLDSDDALFVLGFERSIPAEADFPPALVQLNMARELYRNLPCPLVIVLPDYALTQLTRQAPDFWAWRSGVFETAERQEEAATLIQRVTTSRDRAALGSSREGVRRYLEVLQELLEEYNSREDSDRVQTERLKAHLLTEIANDLALLGELEEAGAAGKQALEIAQRLGDRTLEAGALSSLAVSLMNLGHLEDALDLARRAVETKRELVLAEETPAAQQGLAIGLNTLGVVLGSFERSEEALRANEEAVALLRALPSEMADEFLAIALQNRGVLLRDLGRQEEALTFTKEALEIRRRLAFGSPDIFLPALASGLNNLGSMLIDLDRKMEALQAMQEAAEISRGILAHRPDAEIAGFASNLFNLGVALRGLGRNEEALRAMEEGIRRLAAFASRRPEVFRERIEGQVKRYRDLCAEMGREPDSELLRLLES